MAQQVTKHLNKQLIKYETAILSHQLVMSSDPQILNPPHKYIITRGVKNMQIKNANYAHKNAVKNAKNAIKYANKQCLCK